MRPDDGKDYGRISFVPTMGGLRANIIRPDDGGDYGRYGIRPDERERM
ncbi:MAG: hypothetical protein RL076_1649 [Chloroflexota bacterium]